eukprot:10249771-Lingulodinium_polyedra.AAC.1
MVDEAQRRGVGEGPSDGQPRPQTQLLGARSLVPGAAQGSTPQAVGPRVLLRRTTEEGHDSAKK